MKFLLLLITIITISNAVITIEPVTIKDEDELSGSIQASVENRRGNTEKNEYSGGVKIEYNKKNSYVAWGEIAGAYGDANSETNVNKLFAHLRYIHVTNLEKLNWESFLQSEYNEFTKIQRRRLVGGGVRYDFQHDGIGKLYLGESIFYENIAYTTDIDPSEDNIRFNTYLAYSAKLGDDSNIVYVLYYQPKADNFSDYIFSNGVELKVHVYKQLFLKVNVYYDVDSKPAYGVKKEDFTNKTSFVYDF